MGYPVHPPVYAGVWAPEPFVDYLMFAIFGFAMRASKKQMRTDWFLDSVVSATLIVQIIRTQRLFFKSRLGVYLIAGIVLAGVPALTIRLSPLAELFGFAILRWHLIPALGGIVALYVLTAEFVKKWSCRPRRVEASSHSRKEEAR